MTKISALMALAGGSVDTANDVLAIVDTSATQTKKITVADLIGLVTDITGLLDFKGSTDCSANPNYPAASKGDFYLVSVAGKIGGASGISVTAGDSYFATADNAGGTQAGVGTSWTVIQGNISFTPVNIAGDTMTGDLIVPDEVYDATNWNGSLEVPTKNAVRDKIETLAAGSGVPITAKDEGSSLTTSMASIDFVGSGVTATHSGDNVTVTIAGGGSFVIGDATDVDTTGAAAGDVLAYISGSSDWEPRNRTELWPSSIYEDQKAANSSGGGATSGAWGARVLNTEVSDDIGLSLLSSTVTITIATPGVITWTSHPLVNGSTVVFTTSGALPTGLVAGTSYYVVSAAANTFSVSATLGGAAINTTGSQSGTHTATASAISLAAGTYEVDASSAFFRTDASRVRLRDITNSATLVLGENAYASNTNGGGAWSRMLGRFTLAGTAIVELQFRVTTTFATNGLGVLSNFGEVEVFSRLKLTKIS